MNAWHHGRRRFLKGLTAAAATLPFFPLLDAHAESTPPPKRVVFFFSGNGTVYDSWLPNMVAGELLLSPILSPLEKWKSKLLVVDGLSHQVILEKSSSAGHSAGMNTALTGRKNQLLDPAFPLRSQATGISVDQFLANTTKVQTKLRTLESGVLIEPWTPDTAALSYRGPLQPLVADSSPYRVFDRLFQGFSGVKDGEKKAAAERLHDRQRLLNFVTADLESLTGRLAQSDQGKLEAHLGALKALEHSLTTGAGASASKACSVPERGVPLDIWKNENIPAIARLQIDLMVLALACDLTRFGTLQFGRAGAGHRFTWLGKEFVKDPPVIAVDTAQGFHALAHNEKDAASRAKLVQIHTWYAEQLAYLLGRLDSIPEGDGTLLDNTIVVWMNELGSGAKHSHDRTPWVLAGNVGGFFKTGQLVSFPGQPHNRLLLSLCHALGVQTEVFGDPDYCKAGPLTGITL